MDGIDMGTALQALPWITRLDIDGN